MQSFYIRQTLTKYKKSVLRKVIHKFHSIQKPPRFFTERCVFFVLRYGQPTQNDIDKIVVIQPPDD